MKVAEEYCLAITKEAGRSHCGLSGSSVLECGVKLYSLSYTDIVDHMHTQLRPYGSLTIAEVGEGLLQAGQEISRLLVILIVHYRPRNPPCPKIR